MNLRSCFQQHSARSTLTFLLLLVVGDIALTTLHFTNFVIFETRNPMYNIEQDRGIAEFYQYLKYIWIMILFISLSFSKRSFHYLSWVFLFFYFLLDDSLQIHEIVGGKFAEKLSFSPLLGLRLQDFGELLISSLIGATLLLPLMLCYFRGNTAYRKCSKDILLLILILIFFGVGVDMIHIVFSKISWRAGFMLGVVEDAGEMFAVSLIVVYVYYRLLSEEQDSFYFCEFMPRKLRRV